MEISEIINNLEKYEDIESNKQIDYIIKDLLKYPLQDFIYLKRPKYENSDVINLLYKLDANIIKLTPNNDYNNIPLIKSLVNLFIRGVSENDLKRFLIFLYTDSLIRLPLDLLIKKYGLEGKFHNILNSFSDIIKEIHIEIKEYALKELNEENRFVEKLRYFNLDNKNNFLKSYGTPYHLYAMFKILKKYDFTLYENTLIFSNNIITILALTKNMTVNEVISCYKKDFNLNDKILVCFIKKILEENNLENPTYLKDICLDLYYSDKVIFKKIMKVHDNNDIFNEILGLMMSELDKTDLKHIINNLDLSIYYSNHITKRRKILDNCKDSENLNYILELFFKKWEELILNTLNNSETLINILLTDYCDFILGYYYTEYSYEEIIMTMEKNFLKIKNLDSEWTPNRINYQNKFNTYYSKLVILSYAYKFKNLNNNEIKNLFKEFKEYVLYKNILNDDTKKFLDELTKNINNTQSIINYKN